MKPVIFLAFANDREGRGRYLRNLPEEARRLRAELAGAERAGLCELVVRQSATLEELFAVFQGAEHRDRVAVFHYGGHANGYALLLEGADGGVESAHAAGLAQLLGAQRGLRLVFLNGCATEPQAQGLLDAGVAAVLVTSQAIHDAIALDFAGHFYAGLGGGASIERAYAEAKAAVVTRGGSGVLREADAAVYRPELAPLPERWPWRLYLKEGAAQAVGWNLPQAAGDPLFGLPPLPPGDLPPRPYRHLERFARAHAEIFFGRGREIRALYERASDPQGAPLILLYGRSGVGKSSLLEAGLIPRLAQGHEVRYRRREQALGLSGTLRAALEAKEDGAAAARAQWCQHEQQSGEPLTLILDQVEEVYTRPHPARPEELTHFLDALQTLLADPRQRPRGKLILGFRQEWLPELEAALEERALPRSLHYLPPLERNGLIEAITGPTRTPRLQQHYGLSIEDGLAEAIADTLLADPEAPLAPTLQVLLAKLWTAAKARDPARPHFDSALYQSLKREGFLLGDYLDQALTQLETAHPEAVRSGLVLDLLAYHTTARGTAEERSAQALAAEYAHQHDQLPPLIAALQQDYLLLPTPNGGTRLGHDTLSPLIRARFEESDRPGQRARRILESRGLEWAEGRTGTVLDQVDLGIVEAGALGMRTPTSDEERLLAASREERARRQRVAKRLRFAAVAAVVLIALAAGLASWQWWRAEEALVAEQQQREAATAARGMAETREREAASERGRAERESRLAQARQLAAQADLAMNRPPADMVLGTLLATESLKREQTLEGYRVLSQAMALLPREARRFPLRGDERVESFAFSPDGSGVAAIIREGQEQAKGQASLWDVASARELGVVTHAGKVDAAVFSPDSRLLATGSWDRTVVVSDAATGAEQHRFFLDAPVLAIAFSPDGRRLAAALRGGRIDVLALPTGALIQRLQHPGWVSQLVFGPDGRELLSADADAVHVWEIDTGQARRVIRWEHRLEPVLSANGRFVAKDDVDSVLLWSTEGDGEPLRLAHGSNVLAVDFAAEGARLVTEDVDGVIRLWDTTTGAELARVQKEAVLFFHNYVYGLWPHPSGTQVATLEVSQPRPGWIRQDRVLLWSFDRPGSPVRTFEHPSDVHTATFSPDGRTLATLADDGRLRLWDTVTGQERLGPSFQDKVGEVIFSPDGLRLAVTSRRDASFPNSDVGYSWGEARVWDAASGQELWRLGGASRWLHALAWRPDGSQIATAGSDGATILWDIHTGKEIARLPHAGPVLDLGFTPDGQRLLTRSREAGVSRGNLWDIATGTRVAGMTLGDPGGVTSLSLSRDRRLAATSGSDGTIRVWDTQTGQEIRRFEEARRPDGSAPGIEIAGNGQRLAWLEPDGRTLQVREVTSGDLVTRLAYDEPLGSWALSADGGRVLAQDSENLSIWIREVDSGRILARLRPPEGGKFHQAQLSPVGAAVVTTQYPPGARCVLWDATTGKALAELQHHSDEAGSHFPLFLQGFSADGRYLLTLRPGADTEPPVIHVWDAHTGALIRRMECRGGEIAFGPDSQRLALGDQEARSIEIREMVSGETLTTIATQADWYFSSIELSPDGTRLAAADGVDPWVRVWDLNTGKELERLKLDASLQTFAFLPDSRTLLTLDWGGMARAWDTDSGQERFRLAHGTDVKLAVMDAGKGRIATASGVVAQVWDVAAGRKLAQFSQRQDVEHLTLDPGGQRLATREYFSSVLEEKARANLWDLGGSGEAIQLLHDEEINDIGFSADGSRLMTTSRDRFVRLWDTASGEERQRLAQEGPVGRAALSADAQLLAASVRPESGSDNADEMVSVWHLPSARRLARLPHYGNQVDGLAFSSDGRWLGSAAGTLRLWDAQSARPERLSIPHVDGPAGFEISPDGRRMFSLDRRGEHEPDVIRALDTITGETLFEIVQDEICSFNLSQDGGLLVVRGPDSSVSIWDAASGRDRTREDGVAAQRDREAVSPDGRYAAHWKDGTLQIADRQSERVRTLATDVYVNLARFSPDGSLLATAEGVWRDVEPHRSFSDRILVGLSAARVWDVGTGQETLRLPHRGGVRDLRFSPDGRFLLTEDRPGVRVYEVATGTELTRLTSGSQYDGLVMQDFSPDGRHFAATTDFSMLFWETATWGEVARFTQRGLTRDPILSPDGRYVGVQNGEEVSLWDWQAGREILRVPCDNCTGMAFAPNGGFITAEWGDNALRIWSWRTKDLVVDACSRLERNLSETEWRAYVGNEAYQPTCPSLPVPER